MTTQQLFLLTAERRAKESQMLMGNYECSATDAREANCICEQRIKLPIYINCDWDTPRQGYCRNPKCNCRYAHQLLNNFIRGRIFLAKPIKSLAGTDLHIGAVVVLTEPPIDSDDREYFDLCKALGTTFMVCGFNLSEDMLELAEIDGRPYGQYSPQWTYMAPISAGEKVADFLTIKS